LCSCFEGSLKLFTCYRRRFIRIGYAGELEAVGLMDCMD
jgi:hypothetical protein